MAMTVAALIWISFLAFRSVAVAAFRQTNAGSVRAPQPGGENLLENLVDVGACMDNVGKYMVVPPAACKAHVSKFLDVCNKMADNSCDMVLFKGTGCKK